MSAPAAKPAGPKLEALALSVKRGERALRDLTEGQQTDVRKFLRETPFMKLRALAEAASPARERSQHRQAQPRHANVRVL